MSVARRLGIAAVVVALTVTLFAGNVVVAGHQTVLDPDYVAETVAEEDGYEALQTELAGQGTLPLGETGPLPGAGTELVGRILTPEYLQSQTEANLDRLYAYLHGNERRLRLVVDTAPLKNRTAVVVAETVENTSGRELAEFAGFESREIGGVTVDRTVLAMGENESAFRTARSRVRERVRERVADGQQSAEADRRVNETLRQLRPAVRERVTAVDTGFDAGVDREAGELVGVYVDGLLSPSAEYDEFRANLTAQKAALGEALGTAVRDRLDRTVPNTLAPTDFLPAEAQRPLIRLRAAVVFLDVLGWLLPLLSVAVAAQLWLLADDPGTPVLWTGVAGLLAGLPGLLVGEAAETAVSDQLRAAAPETGEAVVAVLTALAGGVFGTLSAQSLALVGGGVVLAAVGGLVRTGIVDPAALPGGDDTAGDDTGGESPAVDDGPSAGRDTTGDRVGDDDGAAVVDDDEDATGEGGDDWGDGGDTTGDDGTDDTAAGDGDGAGDTPDGGEEI